MNNGLIKIKRVLISVSDKTNIVKIAKFLQALNCELISTGGTAKILEENNINVIEISSITGNPEAFGGRMKTISFNIESALLFDREKDELEAQKLGITPIDMVICNLYPFKNALEYGSQFDTLIENIDIGGPTMIRASAKNFKYVAVITNPIDYDTVIEELKNNDGCLSYSTRRELMRKAFNLTADYDSMIASAMDNIDGYKSLRLSFTNGKELRYGENSHQKALMYREAGSDLSLYDIKVLNGKEISFNNILDINSAIESVAILNNNGCAIIKHTNPCGLCEGNEQRIVFERAWEGDPVSAYGSIIAFNRTLTKDTVEFLCLDSQDKSKRKFVEVIIAPKIEENALDYLKFHKDLRVIEYNKSLITSIKKDIRYLNGALLLQDKDIQLYSELKCVTEKKIDIDTNKDLIEFGLKAISNIKSNAIAVVRRNNGYLQLLGMGAGQPNRLTSTKIALDKCRENLINEYKGEIDGLTDYINQEMKKAILISDAYFPFSDNIIVAEQYGIRHIIQPGGSIRDNSVIRKCDEFGIAMIFTNIRHFKH